MRGLIVATQFLTRLPTPPLDAWRDDDMRLAANWFPVVGLIVGLLLAAAALSTAPVAPIVTPISVLFVWVWVTGAIHLDGLADTADGMGAAHKSPDAFLKVARDPTIGAWGVVTIVLTLLAKFAALGAPMFSDDVVATQDSIVAVFGTLVLVPAWARWVACFCAHELPSLDDGRGASFAVGLSRRALIIQAGAYAAASLVTAPALIVAPVIAIAFIWYWRGKLGGMSGDVMGATIEISEAILLMAVVIAAGLVS